MAPASQSQIKHWLALLGHHVDGVASVALCGLEVVALWDGAWFGVAPWGLALAVAYALVWTRPSAGRWVSACGWSGFVTHLLFTLRALLAQWSGSEGFGRLAVVVFTPLLGTALLIGLARLWAVVRGGSGWAARVAPLVIGIALAGGDQVTNASARLGCAFGAAGACGHAGVAAPGVFDPSDAAHPPGPGPAPAWRLERLCHDRKDAAACAARGEVALAAGKDHDVSHYFARACTLDTSRCDPLASQARSAGFAAAARNIVAAACRQGVAEACGRTAN